MTNPSAATIAQYISAQPHRMTVGLRPLALQDWIECGDDYADLMRQRCALLTERSDVVVSTSGSELAQQELLELLSLHMQQYFPDQKDFAKQEFCWPSDLHKAAAMVPEDLCLMQLNEQGQYHLSAAAVCFPTRWKVTEKLGQALLDIHQPVPGYAEQIGAPTDKIMRSLRSDRPVWRVNWSLLDSPELFQPVRVQLQQPIADDELPERVWIRSERQTLRRLPKTQAVLFTIRVRQCTIAELAKEQGAARRLLTQLQTMPVELRRYKQLESIDDKLCAYLQSVCES